MKVLVRCLLKTIIISFTIFALPRFVPGIVVDAYQYALLATFALALVNLLIRPIVKIVTLPINIFTLGLFGLIVNAVLLWVTARYVPGFHVATFTAAFFGALIISGMNWVVSHLK
jgi:putative membrane protein